MKLFMGNVLLLHCPINKIIVFLCKTFPNISAAFVGFHPDIEGDLESGENGNSRLVHSGFRRFC